MRVAEIETSPASGPRFAEPIDIPAAWPRMTFDTTTDRGLGESPAAPTAVDEPVFLELDEVDVAQASVPPTAAAPGWFSRKRAKSVESVMQPGQKRAAKQLLPTVAVRPEDQAGTAWHEPTLLEKLTHLFRGNAVSQDGESVENPRYQRFRRLLAFAFTGYGVSLILHTFITAALAFSVLARRLGLTAQSHPRYPTGERITT